MYCLYFHIQQRNGGLTIDLVDWLDNSRDIANFLLHYLPEEVEARVLPTRLSRLPASVTKVRGEHGYCTRELVVVGHSFGGCTSLRVAFDLPKLFSSFVLVDPVIHRPHTRRPGYLHQMVLNAFTRRDRWSSREEALQLFQKSTFFGAWDPDVLQLYVDHAVINDSEGGVRLKMSGLQEGLSFANQVSTWETWELLERLDEGITLRWMVPEKPLSTRKGTYERVWRRPANSTNVVFHFAGHLIVQEAPFELAHDISNLLLRKYGSTKPHLVDPVVRAELVAIEYVRNHDTQCCTGPSQVQPTFVLLPRGHLFGADLNPFQPSLKLRLRPRCSGSSKSLRVPNSVHVRPTSWHSQERALFLVSLVALVAFPETVSAAPLTLRLGANIGLGKIHRRGQNSVSPSNGNVSMNVWLPILLVTVVFVLFSVATCVRRCAAGDAATTRMTTASRPADGNTATTTQPRRRPRRTPSQISTKSLPPYMKEPGDQELVLFRGPLETEDDQAPPLAVPALAEDDDQHPGMHGATFDIALDRIESVDTMANSSTNLIRRVSVSVPRPPELHHATMPHDHRRSGDAHSLDSVGSEVELLPAHHRGISVDNRIGPRGEAPSYAEALSAEGGMTTISLNDPESSHVSSNAIVPPPSAAGGGRPRFSFLTHNPFSSRNNNSGALPNVNEPPPSIRSESPALHMRSGSALSRFSSRESHESRHSRTPSRNHNLLHSHSRSNSNLFRAFRSHSPGLHAGSSTISLDSISAPLTHTLTRAEFHAPKGGLLTPEQIKLITSREALEKFGVPYGPEAVAAFSLSRERLAEMGPPPDFESVTGEHQEQSMRRGVGLDIASPTLDSSSSHRPDLRAESRASSDVSYATAPELNAEGHDSQIQTVQVYGSEGESETNEPFEPLTARPMTPGTARPSSLSRDHGSVAKRS
ncbi:hypothetical protein J3R83DRAFT_13707 [Lanmaoa asiatica]|nr:hypothetical protein J3R83DRAFT_13707 [Lanmaoa asiatica]